MCASKCFRKDRVRPDRAAAISHNEIALFGQMSMHAPHWPQTSESTLDFLAGSSPSVMAPKGQESVHSPQPTHFSRSMIADIGRGIRGPGGNDKKLFFQPRPQIFSYRSMAETGQLSTQAPHSLQLSGSTKALLSFSACWAIHSSGQASTHSPQAVHLLWSTTAGMMDSFVEKISFG